jgi:hypothetical protein
MGRYRQHGAPATGGGTEGAAMTDYIAEPDPEPKGDPVCDCGETVGVRWTCDPYAEEINHVYVWGWMCRTCYSQACDDI